MNCLQAIRNRIWRDALPGLLLAALGAAALAIAAELPFRLPSGRPGPGFVPSLIAGALLLLGIAVATGARRGALPDAAETGQPVRPGLLLCAAPLGFAALLPLGFLPAAWGTATLALLAAPGLGVVRAAAGGLALAGVSAILFLGLLGIPAPLLGPR